MNKILITCFAGASFVLALNAEPMIDYTHDRVQTTLDTGMKRIGTVTPRSARDVGVSRLAIGCEMLSRDYGDFEEFKEYIPPLGLAMIRLHAGWAKIEKTRGVYDFEWLDKQVNYLIEHGLSPILETSYGNPIYPGGGGASLSDGMPHGEEALKAWDAYVDALSKRYPQVKLWFCWNEPNNGNRNSAETIADNNIRTARIVKRNIPDAKIGGLLAGNLSIKLVDDYMKILSKENAIGLFEWMLYHDYRANPDTCYAGGVLKWAETVHKYAPNMKIMNGESGATSAPHYSHAISSAKWNSELTQCKWNARRLIGDLGHGYWSLLFTFYDPCYDNPQRYTKFVDPLWIRLRQDRFMKRMGLIKCNEHFKVLKVKPAYYSAQNIASIFDASIEAFKFDCKVKSEAKWVVSYTFKQKGTDIPLVAYWNATTHPDNSNETLPATLTVSGVSFESPVWVDVISGAIYEIPAENIKKNGTSTEFNVPVYDAPGIITEKKLVIR